MNREPRNLREKVISDSRDPSTAVGQVVAGLVGDVVARQSKPTVPFAQRLGKLSDSQFEKVEDAVSSERSRRYEAEDYSDDGYGDDGDDEDDEPAASWYIAPTSDDQIDAAVAQYDSDHAYSGAFAGDASGAVEAARAIAAEAARLQR
jgi:hypothetical protein